MSKRCVFVAMSSQKGGVGKSTMTVLLAGYFHYVMGYNVAVVDCDYPHFSIKALRSRDTQNVEKNVNLQRMLCGQFDRTGKKAYPVLTSVPGKELKTALPLTGGCDILFFDLPGTVNSPGVIKTIVNMDYVFTRGEGRKWYLSALQESDMQPEVSASTAAPTTDSGDPQELVQNNLDSTVADTGNPTGDTADGTAEPDSMADDQTDAQGEPEADTGDTGGDTQDSSGTE